jgi:hypothetical protein
LRQALLQPWRTATQQQTTHTHTRTSTQQASLPTLPQPPTSPLHLRSKQPLLVQHLQLTQRSGLLVLLLLRCLQLPILQQRPHRQRCTHGRLCSSSLLQQLHRELPLLLLRLRQQCRRVGALQPLQRRLLQAVHQLLLLLLWLLRAQHTQTRLLQLLLLEQAGGLLLC